MQYQLAGRCIEAMRSIRWYNPTRYGWPILLAVAVLCGLGLAGVYATEFDPATRVPVNTMRQIAYVAAGVSAMLAVLAVGYRWFGRWAYLIYGLVLVLLGLLVLDRWIDLPLIPASIRGTRRWIRLPLVQIQPSEFTKLAYVVALAWYLRYRKNYRRLPGLIGPFLLTLLPMLLILLEPDLGTVVLLMPVLLVMLYAAGARARHLLIVLLACVAVTPGIFRYVMRPYQRLRLLGPLLQSEQLRAELEANQHLRDWLRISQAEIRRWDLKSGYQLTQSKIALGSGGPTGQGLLGGAYVRYTMFLPDKHNDFIFAVVGQQWGLVGTLLILVAFGLIVVFGVEIATLTDEPFARLLVIGIVSLLATQALCNMGMTVGLTPITGITLPFVSFGGSSMVASFLAVGLIINVAQCRPLTIARKPFEFDQPSQG